jgi:hypothetical protein
LSIEAISLGVCSIIAHNATHHLTPLPHLTPQSTHLTVNPTHTTPHLTPPTMIKLFVGVTLLAAADVHARPSPGGVGKGSFGGNNPGGESRFVKKLRSMGMMLLM